MQTWVALLCLLGAVVISFVMPAAAQPARIEGVWSQVETSAGSCPTCRVEVARKGGSLIVTANNGWSASVTLDAAAKPVQATGTGSWASDKRGWVAGRPFDVVFRLIDQRLHMSMQVTMADGAGRRIEAVFERFWLGA